MLRKKTMSKIKLPKKPTFKKLDPLWSKCIRLMYPICIVCKSDKQLQAHHCIIRKGSSNITRYELMNGVTLCKSCHIYKLHGQQADKWFYEKYLDEVNKRIPKEIQDQIYIQSKTSEKLDLFMWELYLKQEYERLKLFSKKEQ